MTTPQNPKTPEDSSAPEAPSTPEADSWEVSAAQKVGLGTALKQIPLSVWLLVIAALIFVGGLGYIVGTRSPAGIAAKNSTAQESLTAPGQIVNMAGAIPGTANKTAKAKVDGTFDAMIQGQKPGTKLESPDDLINLHRRMENDPFAIGPVDAPVVMTVFSDFECPFCAKFATESEPNLIKDYVDRGLLRIEWNDLAINGDRAVRSAEAGRAAAEQGKFWEFSHQLFEAASKKSGHPDFKDEDLIGFAEKAGVADMSKFKEALASDKFKDVVLKASQYGQGLGIQGTPQFLIGTSTVSGALPESEFRDRIELALMGAAREQSAKPGTK